MMELDLCQTQEEMSQGRAGMMLERNMREDFSSLREEFSNFGQQLSPILRLFSRMPNASLPMNFPLRTSIAPILARSRGRQCTLDLIETKQLELVSESSTRGASTNPYHTPRPRLDISVFEGNKPRWWIG